MKVKTVVFAVLMVWVQVAGTTASGSIKWYSYKEGMALAEKEKKKAFIHFWTAWCPSCKKMEKETFLDSAVITYLNKNFISIKVNSDVESELSSEFGIRGVPDNWFISENSKPIINQPGYLPSKIFLPILKYIHTDSFKKMSLSKFMRKKG